MIDSVTERESLTKKYKMGRSRNWIRIPIKLDKLSLVSIEG